MTQVDVTRLSGIVADRLQDRIIAAGLPPGAKLPTEPELMNEFGISRTVVREAAALLVSRGIVDVRPRRGMTVRAPDGAGLAEALVAQLRMSRVTIPQLLDVRITLETAVARLAAGSRSDADLAALSANVDRMTTPGLDQPAVVAIDVAFHELLAAATRNPFFPMVMRPVNDLLRALYAKRAGYMTHVGRTVAEHRAIIEAVGDRDADRAEAATRRHLAGVEARFESILGTTAAPAGGADGGDAR